MILMALLTIMLGLIKLLLTPVPNIPPLPESIQDILNFIVNFVSGGFGFIMHIYTPVLAGALVMATLALLFFNQGYYIVVWILKRLRIWE